MKRILVIFAFLFFGATLAVVMAQGNIKGKLSISTQMFLKEQKGDISLDKSKLPHRRLSFPHQGIDTSMHHGSRIIAAPDTIDGRAYIPAFILLDDNDDVGLLEDLDVVVQCKFAGGLVTASIPVDKLLEVAAMGCVRRISVAKMMEPLTDKTREATNADDVLANLYDARLVGLDKPYDGTGVVLGIIDSGIDFQHIAFKDKDGNTRIKRAYVYDGEKEHLYNSDTVSEATTDDNEADHGTHTASTAGGSSVIIDGNEVTVTDDHTKATYGGIAPGADLYLAGIKGLADTYIANAFQKICSYADSVGKPVVVSNSWGSQYGPHDGNGDFAPIVNQFFGDSHPNHVCLFAAGNEAGNNGFFLTGTASKASPLGTVVKSLLTLSFVNYDNTIASAWTTRSANGAGLGCKVLVLDENGNVVSSSEVVFSDEEAVEVDLGENALIGTIFAFRDYVPSQGKSQIVLQTSSGGLMLKSGQQLAIQFYPEEGSGRVDVWNVSNYSKFTDTPSSPGYTWTAGTDDMTVCEEATLQNVISVGAYVSKNEVTDHGGNIHSMDMTVGQIGSFSSYATATCSPTGLTYPWITAPGATVVAAVNSLNTAGQTSYINGNCVKYGNYRVNSNTTYPYGSMNGTSMATPTAAGIVALWLQAAQEVGSELTVNDVKQIMKETARHDNFTDGDKASHFGNGKIDALAGLQLILGQSTGRPAFKTSISSMEIGGVVGKTQRQTFTVTGRNLKGDITLSMTGSSQFSVTPTRLSPVDGSVDSEVTVTFTPSGLDTQTATLTLASEDTQSLSFSVNGTAEAITPQVLWCEGNHTLYFTYSDTGYVPGDTYDGQTVTSSWFGPHLVCRKGHEREVPIWATTQGGAQQSCTRVVFDASFAKVRPVSTYAWFSGFHSLTDIEGMGNLNTGGVSVMRSMFQDCSSLRTINLDLLDVSSTTDASSMFSGCTALETIYCANSWEIGKTTGIFSGCEKLKNHSAGKANPDDGSFTLPQTNDVFAGSGTQEDPYLISTTTDWNHLAAKVNGHTAYNGSHFRLTADLSFADYYTTDETNFTSVGIFPSTEHYLTTFEGSFDGQGHRISDLKCIKPSTNEVALFSNFGTGELKNLTLHNAIFTGNARTGGIVGHLTNGSVTNCHVSNSCTITANGTWSGGVIGANNGGYIYGCTFAATLRLKQTSGGIAGYNGGIMEDCLYLSDTIEASDNSTLGGIAGINDSSGKITNCLISSQCLGLSTIGCDLGNKNNVVFAYRLNCQHGVTLQSSLSKSYTAFDNAPAVSLFDNGILKYDGVNYVAYKKEVPIFYQEGALDGMPKGFSVISSTGDDMSCCIHSYALTMPDEDITVSLVPIWGLDKGADGSPDNPFLIAACHDMNALANMVNEGMDFEGSHFKLVNDLNYHGFEYTPIGRDYFDYASFNASFDGNGKTIEHVKITKSNLEYNGLFGCIGPQGEVKDLSFKQSDIYGNTSGGIAGYCLKGKITGCFVDFSVDIYPLNEASPAILGGIAGYNSGTIAGCLSLADIGDDEAPLAQGSLGGIVGTNDEYGKIIHCVSYDSDIIGKGRLGAIVGANNNGTLQNNFYYDTRLKLLSDQDTEKYRSDIGCGYDQATQLSQADITTHNAAVKGIHHPTPPSWLGQQNATYPHSTVTAYDNGLTFRGGDTQYNLLAFVVLQDDADNSQILSEYAYEEENVILSGHTLRKDGYWNTLCLPFSVLDGDVDDQHPEATGGRDGITFTGTPLQGATVKSLHSATFNNNNATLTLSFSDDITKISRRKPYIVKWDTNGEPIKDPTFSHVEIYGSDPIPSECDAADFIGTYQPITFNTLDHTILYLGDANNLYYPNPDQGQNVTIPAFHAYFRLNDALWASQTTPGLAPINAFIIDIDGVETRITTHNHNPTNTTWHTIDGRKLTRMPTNKGIYISNARKVVIK